MGFRLINLITVAPIDQPHSQTILRLNTNEGKNVVTEILAVYPDWYLEPGRSPGLAAIDAKAQYSMKNDFVAVS